ncbi:PREDICTED: uncharacterized protein LOC108557886 [Nicrophorus vespilloides]|uniref:Large ribosomal subunit protein bL34m n=1 Tax=Nicrophorus vespilloides TaxID=110193 RepID=A0ABM1M685_NICVS|nr:PREDICTED: uncharacterized protein LOC108557886 [Nicrophorus vespilloides]
MSFLTRLLPALSNVRSSVMVASQSTFHSLAIPVSRDARPGGLFSLSIRNVIRCHFPRPSERKRIKRHGWEKRMSTPEGRRVLMRRILKGKHVYSH